MKLVVSESQYKTILLEEKINTIIDKIKNARNKFISHMNKTEKIFDVDLNDLKSQSMAIGGMSYFLNEFLNEDGKNLKKEDIGLIISTTLLPYFSKNLKTIKKLLEEIKKRKLVDYFDTCLEKFNSLKDSFENFMKSLDITFKKDPLSYSFLLPVIPDLYFMGNNSKYKIDIDQIMGSNQNQELGVIVDEIINKFSN
jgi:hypothetical protein